MDNPYLPPTTSLAAPSDAEVRSNFVPPDSNRTGVTLLAVSLLLIGATLSQAASLGTSLLEIPTTDSQWARSASRTWVARVWLPFNLVAVAFGVAGFFCVLRRGSLYRAWLIVFLALFTAASCYANFALAWPWRLYLGVMGSAVNLLGLALSARWIALLSNEVNGPAITSAIARATGPIPPGDAI